GERAEPGTGKGKDHYRLPSRCGALPGVQTSGTAAARRQSLLRARLQPVRAVLAMRTGLCGGRPIYVCADLWRTWFRHAYFDGVRDPDDGIALCLLRPVRGRLPYWRAQTQDSIWDGAGVVTGSNPAEHA